MMRLLPLLVLFFVACGSSEGKTLDAPIDAEEIDAFSCPAPLTACGELCVNLDNNENHCGTCDNACGGGQICSNQQCACAQITVPQEIHRVVGQGFDQFGTQPPFGYGAILTLIGSTFDGVILGFDPMNTALNQSMNVSGGVTPPTVGYVHDVDIQTGAFAAAYVATTGTIEFTEACNNRVAATLTNATFEQVDINTQMVIPNGCSFQVASVSLQLHDNNPCP